MMILIVYETSVTISSRNFEDFCSVSNMIKWFATDKLVLNLDDTNIMKFITKNSAHSTLYIGYKVKYIEETVNTKVFFCLQIDSHINWRNHMEQMIPQLSAARYAIRSMVRISNINTPKSIHYCMSFWYKIWNTFWG